MKKPQIIAIAVAILLVIVGIVGFVYLKSSRQEQTEVPKKQKIVEPVNVIPVNDRPVLSITPTLDGRYVQLAVKAIKKPAQTLEYELEYMAGTLLQGVVGVIDIDTLPSQITELLGSCSAGGKCSYHENVQGGSLILRFEGEENYSLKQDWKFIDNKEAETDFSSRDAKFQIVSDDLKKQKFIIIYNSPGYPDGLEREVVSDPYSLTASSALSGEATLTMRANSEVEATIMGWDGKSWHEFEGSSENKMTTAEVELMELYVLVAK